LGGKTTTKDDASGQQVVLDRDGNYATNEKGQVIVQTPRKNPAGFIDNAVDAVLHPSGSTTITVKNTGHEMEQETRATIGEGEITIAGELQAEESELLASLNRDVGLAQEITKDEITGALDYSVTIDHKVVADSVTIIAKGGAAAVKALDELIDAATGYKKEIGKIEVLTVVDANGNTRKVSQKELEENYKKETGKDWKKLTADEQNVYLTAQMEKVVGYGDNIDRLRGELKNLVEGTDAWKAKMTEIHTLQNKISAVYMTMPAESEKLKEYHTKLRKITDDVKNSKDFKNTQKKSKDGTLTEDSALTYYQKVTDYTAQEMGTTSINMTVKWDYTSGLDGGNFQGESKTSSTISLYNSTNYFLDNIAGGTQIVLHEAAGHGSQWYFQNNGGFLMPESVEQKLYETVNTTYFPASRPIIYYDANGKAVPDYYHNQLYYSNGLERINIYDTGVFKDLVKRADEITMQYTEEYWGTDTSLSEVRENNLKKNTGRYVPPDPNAYKRIGIASKNPGKSIVNAGGK
jgi:hypothetical protein